MGLLGAAFLLGSCRDRPSLPDGPPPPRARPGAVASAPPLPSFPSLAQLAGEQGLEIERDPAGPPGDLAAEIEGFVDLKNCVRARRLTDAAVADSLEALGYDSFLTDACRGLDALKSRSKAPCGPILSSALRLHCEAQVGMLAGDPALCPVDEHVTGLPQHDPLCLAAARRDVRPCAALPGQERATCEGLVAHDPARCGLDDRCSRLVHRWKPVLPMPLGRPPHASRITVDLRGEAHADAGPEVATFELATEAAAGAVLVRKEGKTRLLIGDPHLYLGAAEDHGGGLVVELPSWPPGPGTLKLATTAVRLTWRQRPLGPLELATGSTTKLTIEQLEPEPNHAVKLTVDATVGPASAPRRLHWQIDTWLRDLVLLDEPEAPP
jgi:hypothetical protein